MNGATTDEPTTTPLPETPKRKRFTYNPNRVAHTLDKLGLGYFSPVARLIGKDEPAKQLKEIATNTFLPLFAFAMFVALWGYCSTFVKSDSVKIPSPAETWMAWAGTSDATEEENAKSIVGFAKAEKTAEAQFYVDRDERVATFREKASAAAASGNTKMADKMNSMADKFESKTYQGNKTFFDQIAISLLTISIGFVAATLLAIPLGILCGLSKNFNIAVNPLVQLFKPVSPLAWFPVVFVLTTWGIDTPDSGSIWQRALFTSAGVVMLCSMWPTLINTAVGVASVDKDHLNVAKVLKLGWFKRVWKIILPASLPLIFTGLRLSIGVGWMVLIAADMMAQNQGLGKFVWDMYQNGDTASTAQIIIAVFFIGGIGFLLDRIMLVLQRLVTFDEQSI
jgi:nitrate/nitrite transport system permease protein